MFTTKRIVVSCLIVLFLFTFISAEESESKLQVAILDFEKRNVTQDFTDMVRDTLLTAMLNTNLVKIVERGEMDKVMGEAKLQMAGITDTSKAIEMGKMLSAEKMVLGSVAQFDFGVIMNVRVVDIQSGEIEVATKEVASNQRKVIKSIDKLAVQLVSKLTGKTLSYGNEKISAESAASSFSTMKVINAYDDKVIISAGSEENLQVGQVLEVFNKNRRTGKMMVKGKIKVTQVFEGYSDCVDASRGFCSGFFGRSGPIIVASDFVRKIK